MTDGRWLVPAPDVGWVADEEEVRVYVAKLPHEAPVVLDGTAALIWLALRDGGTAEEAAASVAEATGADLGLVREPTTTFVDELVSRGLFVPGPCA